MLPALPMNRVCGALACHLLAGELELNRAGEHLLRVDERDRELRFHRRPTVDDVDPVEKHHRVGPVAPGHREENRAVWYVVLEALRDHQRIGEHLGDALKMFELRRLHQIVEVGGLGDRLGELRALGCPHCGFLDRHKL